MRVFDCCPFFQEYDLAAIRVDELVGLVEPVLITSNRTHAGAVHAVDAHALPKSISVFEHDLSHEDGNSSLAATRRREMGQRNAIATALDALDAADDDLVLISDVDEIPRRATIAAIIDRVENGDLPDGGVITLRMELFYYDIQTRAEQPQCWNGTRIARVKDVLALSPHIIRYGIGLPDQHYPIHMLAPNAGWHCSYFGGALAVQRKMTNFLHQELATPANTDLRTITERMGLGQDAYGREEQRFITVDGIDRPGAMTYRRYPHCFHTPPPDADEVR